MSNDKTILVTGCTSGIGLDLVRYMSDREYEVVLVGRNEDKLKELSDELNNSEYCVCDIMFDEQIKNVFSFIETKGIKLNGLVHCAGTGSNVPIRLFREDEMREQMQLHYYAFLEMLKYFYSRKISADHSSIVGISSLAVNTKRKGSTLYSSAMNAMNTAVSVAAKEFLKRGIRVNSIMPAYVDTRLNDELNEYINLNELQPMGIIPTRAISEVVEFLLSEKSRYITGANIPISAGMEG